MHERQVQPNEGSEELRAKLAESQRGQECSASVPKQDQFEDSGGIRQEEESKREEAFIQALKASRGAVEPDQIK